MNEKGEKEAVVEAEEEMDDDLLSFSVDSSSSSIYFNFTFCLLFVCQSATTPICTYTAYDSDSHL